MERAGRVQAELFADLTARGRRRGGPGMAASLLVHACAAALAVLAPLFLAPSAPEPLQPPLRIFLSYDPPPPPPPPLARGAGLAPRPAPAATPAPEPPSETALVAPGEAATVSAPEPEVANAAGGDPSGAEVGDPLGMPGGVPGGVVGGVPGGVLGGVIGSTGTGPIPAPVLRPDRPPRPIRITQPVYPQDAFVNRIEGTVLVEILIDERGEVVRARVLSSIPALDAEAIRTVQRWLFTPAIHEGRPVATVARAPVTFRIY